MNELLSNLLLFLPLLLTLWLANVAERDRRAGRGLTAATLATYALAVGYGGLLFFAGIAIQGLGATLPALPAADVRALAADFGFDPAFAELVVDRLPLIGAAIWLPALGYLISLLKPLRRLAARLLPEFDADHHVHAVALALAWLVPLQLLAVLAVGLDVFLQLQVDANALGGGNALAALWSQQLLTALLGVVGVGWLSRRGGRALLQRLKLGGLTRRQLGITIGVALAAVPLAGVLGYLGEQLGLVDAAVEALAEELFGPLLGSIAGILTIGAAAAIGEETIFRGALQPRFGNLATALLFALLHSQYGLSLATLVAFILGFGLGVLRDRYNTTAAMVAHAIYNTTLGALAFVGAGF